ncbi:hypothetical protein F5Y17DRAFT_434334 [Xylariaceae sp. FL0594]|nr:hypothetical protein F5Y17DRAFT_434334 [Xylariaceae sp. FL0594]
MSTARLTFLYPHLFRAARLAESAVQPAKPRYRSRACACSHSFATSTRTRHAAFERHGHAVEPTPVTPETAAAAKLPQPHEITPQLAEPAPEEMMKKAKVAETTEETEPPPPPGSDDAPSDDSNKAAKPDAKTQKAAENETMKKSGPMKAVLEMPPPEQSQYHPPHIPKPQYVHHFDSYTLVKQLEGGGYSREQAITVMKAVRAILAQNLDVAQEGLVGKSDVDNETYLFRAACSELSSEVTNSRRAADEQTRQQRTQLQHEVDILSQRMSQDIMTLKDDVKGMFNDRRMNVRDEQRNMENAIQRLNLKISVDLNSDSRSEIEGLRWVLIRRSVLGIIFMAIVTLSTLRYATYVSRERQKEAAEKARQAEELKKNGGREDRAPPVDAAEILAAN